MEFFSKFLDANFFMPHGHCYYWRPDVLWLHVISDLIIALAYYSIPVALFYFVKKRKDLVFNWMFVLFGVFILACGTTHIMNIVTVWYPFFFADGTLKAFTAAASILTALLLWPLIPRALAIPSPAEFRNAEKQRIRAEALNQSKDEFLAILSHELRTPLTAILGWTQLLREGELPPNTQKTALEAIERNTILQRDLINDLLDVSRIIAGKMSFDKTEVQLDEVLKSSVESMRLAAEQKKIILEFKPIEPVTVLGNFSRLQQVFNNLISNSIKFTEACGRITISSELSGSHVEIKIQDTGQGIESEHLPYIFNHFFQADNSITRRQGGLGLGLAIVKSLLELHGGLIRVSSPGLNLGSTFTLTLPRIEANSTHDLSPSNKSVSPEDVLKNKHILVVDDVEDSLMVIRHFLERTGAHVTIAGSVAEALSLLEKQKVDLLISDIGMPGEDGFALIKKVRQSSKPGIAKLPAVALTAYAREEERVKILESGFQAHIPKPVEYTKLIQLAIRLI